MTRRIIFASDVPAIIAKHDLMELIRAKDTARVRRLFDDLFLRGEKPAPEWNHLKEALLGGDQEVVRLLHVWGAPVTDESLKSLREEWPEEYLSHLSLLRRARVPLSKVALAEAAAFEKQEKESKPVIPCQYSTAFPVEWRRVLASFQANGAPEAVIAGGALRDTLNGKPIKDVDIFLRSRWSPEKNVSFLLRGFERAGLEIDAGDMIIHQGSYGYSRSVTLPTATPGAIRHLDDTDYKGFLTTSSVQSWKLRAGPGKTEYNILFVDGKTIAEGKDFARGLVAGMDIGLCQIWTDGVDVMTTEAYRNGVWRKRIALINDNDGSKEHLKRVAEKYQGWSLCPRARALLSDDDKIGRVVPGKGIYIGKWAPKDRWGNGLGKTFNLYAAPEDLGVERTFDATVEILSGLKGWHGYDGAGYNGEKELLRALANEKYKGGWFIPTLDILSGQGLHGAAVQSDSLRAAVDKGALKGGFSDAGYWSCTEGEGAGFVWAAVPRGTINMSESFSRDVLRFLCRPVRVEPS